jgi:hypothetical protein
MTLRALALLIGLFPAPALAQAELAPGQWSITTRFQDAASAKMAPEALAAINGSNETRTVCLKAGEFASRAGELLSVADGRCEVANREWSGEGLRFVMRCIDPSGSPMESRVTAKLAGDSFQAQSRMSAPGPEGAPFTMTAIVDGRRTGECPAS